MLLAVLPSLQKLQVCFSCGHNIQIKYNFFKIDFIFVSTHTGSKTVAGTKAAVGGVAATGKSSQIQVIFNGKILTPQSLIQRKGPSGGDGGHRRNKVDRGFVDKNDTIDEDAPEDSEKPVLPATRQKR